MIIKQITRTRKPLDNNLAGRAITESYENRYGIWGEVIAAHSDSMSVDVMLENGFKVSYVPIASREWFNDKDSSKVTGERDLPPKGSRVFLFMPDGRIETSFVLCSGYNRMSGAGESALAGTGKERERLTISPGNWKRTYNYDTGDIVETSPDGKITISIKPDSTVTVAAFDTTITSQKSSSTSSDGSLTINTFDTTITLKNGETIVSGKKATVNFQQINLNGSTKKAARKDDTTQSTIANDSTFWTWITAAGAVLAGLGVAVPIPSSLAGTITGGSGTVNIGD